MKTAGSSHAPSHPLSPALALRIGLAARALPGNGAQRLMRVLVTASGLPLSAEKLQRLTLAQLRLAADGELAATPRACLRQVLGYLRGDIAVCIVDEPPPSIEAYRDGDMPGSLRVAVATASAAGETIDAAFSSCAALLVYQVSRHEIRLIDRREPAAAGLRSERDAQRAALIDDCHLVYAQTLSNPATACLMRNGIHPLRTAGRARERLAELQAVMLAQPAPWITRAMGEAPAAFAPPPLVQPAMPAAAGPGAPRSMPANHASSAGSTGS